MGVPLCLCMGIQVVIGPVGKTHRLDPAEPVGEDLRIPAVGGIVRPLIGEVLAEAEPFRFYPDRDQHLVGEGNIVGEILVCDNALVHGFPHRECDRRLALLLLDPGEERHRVVRVSAEPRVPVLRGRVDEDLGLGLRELAEPDHTLPGRNLVPVGLADLDGTERELVAVEPEQAGKVHEHPLRCLGAQVSGPLGTGADGCLEHQVEPEDLDRAEHFLARKACAAGECCGRVPRSSWWMRS